MTEKVLDCFRCSFYREARNLITKQKISFLIANINTGTTPMAPSHILFTLVLLDVSNAFALDRARFSQNRTPRLIVLYYTLRNATVPFTQSSICHPCEPGNFINLRRLTEISGFCCRKGKWTFITAFFSTTTTRLYTRNLIGELPR